MDLRVLQAFGGFRDSAKDVIIAVAQEWQE